MLTAKFAVQLLGKLLFAVVVGVVTTLTVESIHKAKKRRKK